MPRPDGFDRVSKQNPCPICDHPDWCMVSKDGKAAFCQRVETGAAEHNEAAGWLHWLEKTEKPYTPRPKKQTARKEPEGGDRIFLTMDDLRADIQRNGWKIAREFEYRDSAGEWVFSQIRIEKAGEKKQYRPARPVPNGFSCSLPEGERPLYNLAELLTNTVDPVLIVEGEKCAEAAKAQGLLTVTSAGGSSGAGSTDWGPLKDRDVIISPDNDDPGRKYAEAVRELTLNAGARSARIVGLQGLPKKGDIADRIEMLEQDGKEPEAIGASLRAELRWDALAPDMRRGPRALKEWLACPELKQRTARLPSGFPDLDKALEGGFVPESLYVLAGMTGGGKTSLARNIVRRVALAGSKVLLVTLEDRPIQCVRKLLSASAQLPYKLLEDLPRFTEAQREALRGAKNTLLDLPIHIDGDTRQIDALATLVSAYAQQGTKLVVVDHFSWLNAEGDNAFERASTISRKLKEIALDTGVVLLALCQVNRAGSKSNDPTMHDLRNSGQIEEDSDGVIVLKGMDTFFDGRPAVINTAIEKHRHGPQGTQVKVQFSFWGAEARVETFVPFDMTGVRA